MKVSGPGPVSNASKAKGAGKAGGEGFSKFLDSASNEGEVHAAAGPSRIAAVNFINEVAPDGKGRRRELINQADEILEELSKIRDALLSGNISVSQLRSIEAKIAVLEANCDKPELNEIIEEVKTRAAVELAKLGF